MPTEQDPPTLPGVALEVDGAVGRITIDRPAKLNALNRAVLDGLITAAGWFDGRPDVKVVVVRGEGRAFSAGFDLADPTWRQAGPPERSAATGRTMADAVAGMTAITIAAVHGHCIGGGVVLAAACDLRVAADDAVFRIPEIDVGIPLYWNGVPLLARLIGPARTKELVLTGRPFDAAEADRLGFVNRVVSAGALPTDVDELARALAAKPALVLRTTKAQVDAVVPPATADDGGAEADTAGLAAAFADPEARALGVAYRDRTLGTTPSA